MEEYEGVKFKLVIGEGTVPKIYIEDYLKLDNKLSAFINPKENDGNMSIRTSDGFLIKKAGAQVTQLDQDDVVLVRKVDGDLVYAIGGEPSSEAMLHYEIYKNCADASIILHFHDDRLLKKAKGTLVKEYSYGTRGLAVSAGKAAKKSNIIILKGHGLVLRAKDDIELIDTLKKLFGRQ
ncbi:class II aldolase/adducin family protein [Candidatus Micrarchaeota archaeon]|nr:class II aldolase/adducin family protein [Candidatus Micrarchaeota archaeon]MBU1165869.1 class II aldolase/adducin family protein [Candidatus Micrarchaeota archaeon]MBU1886370.1 class II aldolase/adducin family protein [Candidatus Micrarchaeota archaeon]